MWKEVQKIGSFLCLEQHWWGFGGKTNTKMAQVDSHFFLALHFVEG